MTPQAEARRAMFMTLSLDVLAAMFAMSLAIFLRWQATSGAPVNPLAYAFIATLIFGGAAFISFFTLGIHRQVWRHSGWPDAVRIIQAVGLTAMISLLFMFFTTRLTGFPRTALPIAIGIWSLLIFSGRMLALARSTQRPFQIFQSARADAPPAILVARSEQAAEVLRGLRNLQGGAPVRILALMEAEGAEPGRAIRGVPVMGGLDYLGNVLKVLTLRYGRTPWVAVAGIARERSLMNKVLETAADHGAEVMALGLGSEGLHLQPVRPSDLLARPVRCLDAAPVKRLFAGKRVFVTGAGGTIGSELSMQCAALGVSHLTLYDASEYNLYQIDLSLREKFPDLDILTQLGDVRDPVRLRSSVELARPDIMIHAAALKHVPLMEMNSCEAILTNLGGAVNAIEAAIEAGLERFVFISTDKAVDPDNVMGATKRLAELALAYRAMGTDLAVSMVRFGNVLGSSGSVVPLFERQIKAGGPVTLTHDEVSRYFMTVEEASALVLQGAAHNGSPGAASLYVLDMGDPIRIRALAEAMIRMKGMVPDQDIEIQTTGLRPGEKLHEELTYPDERLQPTGIEGLNKVTPEKRRNKPIGFDSHLDSLLTIAAVRSQEKARLLLSQMVAGHQLPASPYEIVADVDEIGTRDTRQAS